MNAAAPPPAAPAPGPAKRLPVLRRHADFLPAAIEILETPPAPNRITFMMTICAFVAVALTWSYFGRIDIIASAQGKVQPTGRVKIIQPVETGKVASVGVVEGQTVRAGDVVATMDASDARADERAAAAELASWRAESLRRRAVLLAADRPQFAAPPIAWPDAIPPAIRDREERILAGDIAQLAATVASFDAQIASKEAERHRLAATIAAQTELVNVLQQRVDMRSTLVKSGAGALTNLIDARENFSYHSTNLAMIKGQLEESLANAKVLAADRIKAIDMFVADNRQRLGEAERRADDAEQKVTKARDRIARLILVAPIAGTVTASTISSPGQVLTIGEEIMRIVPSDAALEIVAYLENKDIGFVRPGQAAEVKIESFPFVRFGTLQATVVRVSHDAIPDQDAQALEGNPAGASKSIGFAGAQRTQNLVFPMTLTPQATTIVADGKPVAIAPGMAVTVEVRTGSRRILEYLFSPLVETASRALRER